MEYYTAEQKVTEKMGANPTIPAEAFKQLVQEEFFGNKCKQLKDKYCGSTSEVNDESKDEDGGYAPYPKEEVTDHDLELEVENRQ